MKKLVESALFLAGKQLSIDELSNILENPAKGEIKKAIQELRQEYKERGSPIEITEEGGMFKLELKPEYLDKVKNLAPQMDMNRAVLTTLSYIAYKQPVTQSSLVKKFGNRIYDYVKELVKRGFIRAEPFKRSKQLTTTSKLTSYLGIKDIEKLKSKLESAKIERELRKQIEKEKEDELMKPKFTTRQKKKKPREELLEKKELSVDEWSKVMKEEKSETLEKQLDKFEKGSEEKMSEEDDYLEVFELKNAPKKKK